MEPHLEVQDYLCPICLEVLIEPVTMPCQHFLCMPCFKQNVEEANFTCPVCRLRISNWARSAAREGNLVNEELWHKIKKHFAKHVRKRMRNSLESQQSSVFCAITPHVVIAEPGEIRKEYEEQLRKAELERLERLKKEEAASRNILGLMKENPDLATNILEKENPSELNSLPHPMTFMSPSDKPSTSAAAAESRPKSETVGVAITFGERKANQRSESVPPKKNSKGLVKNSSKPTNVMHSHPSCSSVSEGSKTPDSIKEECGTTFRPIITAPTTPPKPNSRGQASEAPVVRLEPIPLPEVKMPATVVAAPSPPKRVNHVSPSRVYRMKYKRVKKSKPTDAQEFRTTTKSDIPCTQNLSLVFEEEATDEDKVETEAEASFVCQHRRSESGEENNTSGVSVKSQRKPLSSLQDRKMAHFVRGIETRAVKRAKVFIRERRYVSPRGLKSPVNNRLRKLKNNTCHHKSRQKQSEKSLNGLEQKDYIKQKTANQGCVQPSDSGEEKVVGFASEGPDSSPKIEPQQSPKRRRKTPKTSPRKRRRQTMSDSRPATKPKRRTHIHSVTSTTEDEREDVADLDYARRLQKAFEMEARMKIDIEHKYSLRTRASSSRNKL